MRLLIDTQVVIWWLEGSTRLGEDARHALEESQSIVWISAVTAWEIVIKIGLGRLNMIESPDVALPRLLASGCEPLAITLGHALGVQILPHHHGDPFDRMLIAQARLEGLTVVTSDPMFRRYDVAVLDASA